MVKDHTWRYDTQNYERFTLRPQDEVTYSPLRQSVLLSMRNFQGNDLYPYVLL